MTATNLHLAATRLNIFIDLGSPDSTKSFLLDKKPLFNNENLIIGTIFQCHELKENILFNLRKHDEKYQIPYVKSYKIGGFDNPFDLSARELECLFCVLRGMTAKRVAEILQLSKRTVEFYISNIKNKFGSCNQI